GGLTDDELLNMGAVIRNGSVALNSFEKLADGFRYGYEWDNNGVKLGLVVDDLNDGNKIFDFYSNRNFEKFDRSNGVYSPELPNATDKGSRPQPTTLKPNPTQKTLNQSRVFIKKTRKP
uniref:DUF3519 domain-containing protein n=1 Tax=Helicobacter acinonychis TaxID=212 RepID=UPI00349FA11E